MTGRGNEARKYLILNGLSALGVWIAVWDVTLGANLVIETIRKFLCYLSVIVWINTAYYLREAARDVDVETWEFQREQVKLTLFILGVLIWLELPVWIASF
jgi:hypothetical protein